MNGRSNVRWSKWFIIGGACIAGGAAVWWYIRKHSETTVKNSGLNASISSCSVLPLGVQSSQKMKDRGNEHFKNCSYNKAVEVFSEAIDLCPPEYKSHLAVCFQNRAAAYDRLGDSERSVLDCTKALELDPLYFKAVVRRARAYLCLNKSKEALDDFTFASLVNPEASISLKADVDKAIALSTSSIIERLKATREAIPIRDESILVWRGSFVNDPILKDLDSNFCLESPYDHALEAIRNGHYEEVIPLVKEDLLIHQSASNSNSVTCILRDYILQARFASMKENVALLKECLVAFNDKWDALNKEMRCNEINKRFRSMFYIFTAALKMFQRSNDVRNELDLAIETDPKNVDIYLSAALLLSENQLQDAIEYLDQLYEIDPAHHLVRHLRAYCEMALKASIGDVGGAMACMAKVDQLLQLNQNTDPVLYLITGRLYYAAQNKDLAKASFKKAAEGIRDHPAPLFYLAMVEAEEMEGSPDQMKVLESKMKMILEKEKANPDALAILAKIAFKRQEFGEALRLYEQCIEICPFHANEASLLLAVTDYVQIRSLQNAVETLQCVTAPIAGAISG
ncbi:unnamed protein product [Thelazia callipaeda]|uniref:Mitochondrial import receptor subunit TOM70 n=1 Tax=Thelazia callipaeda TaxID=103827 RepID=A0A158RC42_THECL|nr:unnamed protein product [Thelazia callipaeda]